MRNQNKSFKIGRKIGMLAWGMLLLVGFLACGVNDMELFTNGNYKGLVIDVNSKVYDFLGGHEVLQDKHICSLCEQNLHIKDNIYLCFECTK